MMTQRCIGISLGLIAGIIMVNLHLTIGIVLLVLLAVIGGMLTLLGLLRERRWQPWHSAAIVSAALALALPLGYWRAKSVIGLPKSGSLAYALKSLSTSTRIGLRGQIAREPELRDARKLDLQINVTAIRVGNTGAWKPINHGAVRLRVYNHASNTQVIQDQLNTLASPQAYGYQLEALTDYRPVADRLNEVDFDFSRYLLQEGVDASFRCHVARTTIMERTRGNPLMELALAAKTDFLDTFKRTIRAPASRVVSAATLGTRRAVEHTMYRGMIITEMFRHAGVGHVLAVSGLHVSVIAILLFALFRMTGSQPRIFVPPLIAFLVLFALLTGARPSSVRAVIMNSVILTAFAYFRCNLRAATAIGLSVSAFFILLLNPVILFSPGFLLSYGAVLSLLILTPPVDRFVRSLRGAGLMLFIIWFVLIMTIAILRLQWLTNLPNVAVLAVILWILLRVGSRLNQHFPSLWNIGIERLPNSIRLFISAQLAIQIGMMIPLSAWFFGQFPVAGVFVNLLAIPAVGMLVQLGMLTGLIGLLPIIGPWVALPVGVAVTIVGEVFLLLAWGAATLFPFPAVPRPTLSWMLAYYGILFLLLTVEQHRHSLLDIAYRLHVRMSSRLSRIVASVPLLLLLPLIVVIPRRLAPPTASTVDILAAGNYPIVVISGDDTADIINSAEKLDGERLLFDTIRTRGATQVRYALLPSPDPRAGMQGVMGLLGKMNIHHLYLPVLPTPTQTLTEAIGDAYLIDQAKKGTRWAKAYDTAFVSLRNRVGETKTRLSAIGTGPLTSWENISLSPLPRMPSLPTRFASSAITPLLLARVQGTSWIMVTDTTPEAVLAAIETAPPCDVLVVPNLGHYRTFPQWLQQILSQCSPRLLVIAGDRPFSDNVMGGISLPPGCALIQTGLDGAVKADLLPNGRINVSTFRTRRLIQL